jgi:hypothetical protein
MVRMEVMEGTAIECCDLMGIGTIGASLILVVTDGRGGALDQIDGR